MTDITHLEFGLRNIHQILYVSDVLYVAIAFKYSACFMESMSVIYTVVCMYILYIVIQSVLINEISRTYIMCSVHFKGHSDKCVTVVPVPLLTSLVLIYIYVGII